MQFVNHWNVMAAGLLFSKEKYMEMEMKKEKHSLELEYIYHVHCKAIL